jgi:FkbM family methyltransferase
MMFPYVARDRIFETDRFNFWIADEVGREWYDAAPNQEQYERLWCRRHITPGMTIVDCGAHHGMMTVLFARWTGPRGRVHAYEALASNAEVIAKNVALNGLDNVLVRAVAVGDSTGRAEVRLNQGNAWVGSPGSSEFVDTRRLDDELRGTRVDFLKIDVEGYELPALAGMRRILRQRPIIDLELHCFAYTNRIDTLRDVLKIVTHDVWNFFVQPTPADVPVAMEYIDPSWLAGFENPHVLGLPRDRPRNRFGRARALLGL